MSLDDVARTAAPFAKWTTSRVANIESGKSLPSLNQLLIYCLALHFAGAETLTLSDLFEGGDGAAVLLTDSGPPIYAAALRRMFSGGVIAEFGDVPGTPASRDEFIASLPGLIEDLSRPEVLSANAERTVRRMAEQAADPARIGRVLESQPFVDAARQMFIQRSDIGEVDERAARALGMSVAELSRVAKRLWGKTFSAERDARAGSDANAQKRGWVTRAMLEEVRAAGKVGR